MQAENSFKRRQFLGTTLLGSAGYRVSKTNQNPTPIVPREGPNIAGPPEGYDLQTGTLVSMRHWMRNMRTWILPQWSNKMAQNQISCLVTDVHACLLIKTPEEKGGEESV